MEKRIKHIGEIWKVGNSHVITIPSKEMEKQNFKKGDRVLLDIAPVVLGFSNNYIQPMMNLVGGSCAYA